MISKSLWPYAASTAASAALIVLLSESKEGWVKSIRSYSYYSLLKFALGMACWCYFFGTVCPQCKKILIRRLLNYRNWIYDTRSRSTKVWGAMLYALIPKEPPLYSLQEYLPKYPLPELDDTCDKALVVFKPLLTEKEYKVFEKLLHQLRTVEGPPLQKILEQRHREDTNWVTPLWDNYAYLSGRSPIAIGSNFACLGDGNHQYLPTNAKPNSLAANVIHYTIRYLEDMESGKVSHMRIQSFVPICCERYKYVLATTRIPHKDKDELIRFEGYKHVVVFCKGYMYKVNCYAENEHGKLALLSPGELQYQIDKLTSEAAGLPYTNNPAIFTTMNRDVWAETRETMKKDATNAASLEAIETSILCLGLTEDSPQTFDAELKEGLCGNGFDRWFDKSFSAFIHKNVKSGFNVEHSTAEAPLTGRMWEYIYYHCARFESDGNACFDENEPHLLEPELLEWKLDQFQGLISSARKNWLERTNDLETRVHFLKGGKNTVKKLKMSPDGFVQIAFQLAFYRLHRFTPKTYESASTRLYLHGRTETIRPFSQHSAAFTKTIDDDKVPTDEKKTHLMEAVKYQTKYKFDAMGGLGVDRHLFGLYVAGRLTGKVPQVFTIPPLCEADHLSTSQSPLRYDEKFTLNSKTTPVGGGFGPQRHDGYGLSYFFDSHDSVHLHCTSFKSHPETGAKKLCDGIQQAMDDMVALMRRK